MNILYKLFLTIFFAVAVSACTGGNGSGGDDPAPGTDTGSDTSSNTDTGSDTDSGIDTGSSTDTGSDTDTGSGTDTGSSTNTDTDSGTGSSTDTDTGIEKVTDIKDFIGLLRTTEENQYVSFKNAELNTFYRFMEGYDCYISWSQPWPLEHITDDVFYFNWGEHTKNIVFTASKDHTGLTLTYDSDGDFFYAYASVTEAEIESNICQSRVGNPVTDLSAMTATVWEWTFSPYWFDDDYSTIDQVVDHYMTFNQNGLIEYSQGREFSDVPPTCFNKQVFPAVSGDQDSLSFDYFGSSFEYTYDDSNLYRWRPDSENQLLGVFPIANRQVTELENTICNPSQFVEFIEPDPNPEISTTVSELVGVYGWDGFYTVIESDGNVLDFNYIDSANCYYPQSDQNYYLIETPEIYFYWGWDTSQSVPTVFKQTSVGVAVDYDMDGTHELVNIDADIGLTELQENICTVVPGTPLLNAQNVADIIWEGRRFQGVHFEYAYMNMDGINWRFYSWNETEACYTKNESSFAQLNENNFEHQFRDGVTVTTDTNNLYIKYEPDPGLGSWIEQYRITDETLTNLENQLCQ